MKFQLWTDSDPTICLVSIGAMHQLYPGESRGAKVTATQPPSTSAAPFRPSATYAAPAQKTTIPGTLHQPLTPKTSTSPGPPRPPWTPSFTTSTLPWEQALRTMEGLHSYPKISRSNLWYLLKPLVCHSFRYTSLMLIWSEWNVEYVSVEHS